MKNFKGKIELIIGFVILLVVIYASYSMSKSIVTEPAEAENIEKGSADVILDPGHGGDDPGKIGINKVLEKDINLSIVLLLKEMLEDEGISVVLTRESDECIDEKGENLSKSADMRRRVKMINEIKPKLVVSVHQNSYSSEEIKGGQVFYFTESKESEKMANIMQEAIRAVDPQNSRQIKADSTYYMLKKTAVPAVIVECGFLSNWEEAEKLATPEYQREMAEAIAGAVKTCLNEN